MTRFGRAFTGVCLALGCAAAAPAAAAPRVVSLDSCADQYVLALAPRSSIAAVSPRADDADSWMRSAAGGVPMRRATMESLLAARPSVAVRYWGGDARLLRALEDRGVRIVQLEDATDFDGVRANVRKAAAAVGGVAAGESLLREMDADLAAARGAWKGRRALYVTSGGYTAGRGTLIDAMLRAAGLTNAASGPGFRAISVERLLADPPALFVKGFYDSRRADRRSVGRGAVIERLSKGRVAASLPGSVLSCPGWFAARGARMIAARAPAS